MVGCGSRVEGTDGKNGRWYGVLAVLLLLLSGSRAAGQGGPGGGASAERWRGYLQELVEEAQAESRVPGLVAALVDADETVAVAAGLRAATPAPAVPIESSDRLNLGSCFKSMTATIAARLVEAGTLSWESTFADYFPEYAASMRPEYQAITIPQLLSHRSGITDDLDIYGPAIELIDGTGPQQRSQFMPLAFATHPAGVAGQFQYSNLGYALVGAVIERRTGETFEAVMRRELAMPLGMTSIQFGAPGTNDLMQITQPLGHDENGRPQLPDEQDSPPAIEPAGIYSMTVDDWAKFVRVQFGTEGEPAGYLSAETLARLQSPVGGATEAIYPEYAYGWGVIQLEGQPLLIHNGSNGSWYSQVIVNTAVDRALLLDANQFVPRGINAVGIITDDPGIQAWLLGSDFVAPEPTGITFAAWGVLVVTLACRRSAPAIVATPRDV